VKGRILISFLALFCMSMVRSLYPDYRTKTVEPLVEELSSFSLTVKDLSCGKRRRIWSNLSPLIELLGGRKRTVPVPKAHGQVLLDLFG